MNAKNNLTLVLVFLYSSVKPAQTEQNLRMLEKIIFEDRDMSCDSGEVCKSFEKCETSLTDWKTKRLAPKTCYFKEKEQFVCCRHDDVNSSHVGAISKKSKNLIGYALI